MSWAPLSSAGYRVITPDYRGAGYSSRPPTGYTKKVLAIDLHTLLTEHVGVKTPVHIVGHDIGGMVAHADANLFPNAVASLVFGECPLPGASIYDEYKHAPGLWHFNFHSVPDLPELLVSGHEKQYLKHFHDRLAQNPAAFTGEDLDFYTTLYSVLGAMRAAFNVYRAFEEDKADNLRWLEEKGKVKVRAMVLSGDGTFHVLGAEKMAREVDEDVVVGVVERSGHYIAEENPGGFVEKVLGFIKQYIGSRCRLHGPGYKAVLRGRQCPALYS
ncbi:MAG: hypothetical protein L6R39_001215 [Caloplaca ligustica]|nr:MAG: hypothetical protein L6R39_001215 [Caloplaca ligustica]